MRSAWQRPLGSSEWAIFALRIFIFLFGAPLVIGGAVVTAGGLILIAAATDNLINAIDIEIGETVWTDVLPAGGQANPMVYELARRQYLVIMACGHHFMETPIGDYVIAYALPPAP